MERNLSLTRRPAQLLRAVATTCSAAWVLTLWLGTCTATCPAETALPSLHLHAGNSDEEAKIIGSGAQLQLAATLGEGEQSADATRAVHYQVNPAGVVSVSTEGLVTPLANGVVELIAEHPQGVKASIRVQVERFGEEIPVDFPNEVVPVFTKFGCNGGGCHGKASGQNGFKLSLLGFEPREDFEHLVLESRTRRLVPAMPDASLLLRKATGELPHGGGAKLKQGEPAYRILREWIEQGMPYSEEGHPSLVRLEVFPKSRIVQRGSFQQLTATAVFSDGHVEDVTRMTQFEPNQPSMAEVQGAGWVKFMDETGDVAVMARYQGMVDVFQATIPLGAEVAELPPVKNILDELVFAKLKKLGLPPSPLADDATFLRRVTIDLTGRLPTPAELDAFTKETSTDKRDLVIHRLLESPAHADYFANKWSALLRNRRQSEHYRAGSFALHSWVRQSIYTNKPFDRFVRELLTASGDMRFNPAVSWFRSVRQPTDQLEDTAQLFLGQRLQCAKCHHHPFEKWSQTDYYGMAAFFSRVERKAGVLPTEELIAGGVGPAFASHPKTGANIPAAGLGSPPAAIPDGKDARHVLVDWMTSADNTMLAKSVVNRYIKHFLGRGLVEPEDDLRITNPASNPQLLDALAKRFIESKYDLRDLERVICQSSVYQLSSEPNEYNKQDKQNYSRFYPRRLAAEVLHDAIGDVTGVATAFPSVPAGTRAVQLPDSGFNSYFLTVFGKPEGATACECERSGDANLAQCLHLLNSSEVQDKLAADAGRAAALAADAQKDAGAKITDLYRRTFSRDPSAEELEVGQKYLAEHANPRQGLEDFTWALINTKEFLFNH